MPSLDGRVVVITGAVGGLGRAYVSLFAAEGAKVVANDLGAGSAVQGANSALDVLVDEIRDLGGEIVGHAGDVSDERAVDELVARSLENFGRIDVLVNNAGTFRDVRVLDTSVDDWDSQARVHGRGHFLTTRAIGGYWRSRCLAGDDVRASIINTTSRSALHSIEGHAAYGVAKAGIITFTTIAAKELASYGVRVNCVAPFARTAMTEKVVTLADAMPAPEIQGAFDPFEPGNVAPLVAYLATRDCPLSGEVLYCHGGTVQRYRPWLPGPELCKDGAWTIDELAGRVPLLVAETTS